MDDGSSMGPAPDVEQPCEAVEDAGRTLHLQWISSHVVTSGNELVDSLAPSGHGHDDPSLV